MQGGTPRLSFLRDGLQGIAGRTGMSEAFISRSGHAAQPLGWTALDLFGVHPLAPASRFDAMGLFLLIQGGAVWR